MTLLDNVKYRDNITNDIEIVRSRINDGLTEPQVNDKFNMPSSGCQRAFARVRRDMLDLKIGDIPTIINCDTSRKAVRYPAQWNAALDEIAAIAPDDITEMRIKRNQFGRTSYNTSITPA